MLTMIRRFASSRVWPPKNLDCVIFFFIWLYSIPFLGLALTIAIAILLNDHYDDSSFALTVGGIFAIPHVIDIIVRIAKLMQMKKNGEFGSGELSDEASDEELSEDDD
ncbi:hypothetical protein [uncultured Fibrobacter sp.]|uniref:hypothetical protein n=1 Tax=uncultured Fibrobacter sp. TaxID=261512 RepID=UPI0025D59372|nr:hypothetical protein [uncultured Fibrobacter sp.]